MEIRIARANHADAMLAHQTGCFRIVPEIALQQRHLALKFGQHIGMAIGWGEHDKAW